MDEYRPQFDERKFRNLVLYNRAARLGRPDARQDAALQDAVAERLPRVRPASDARSRAPTTCTCRRARGRTTGRPCCGRCRTTEGLLLRTEPRFAHAIQRPLAQRQPELDSAFTPSEIAIVEEVLRQFEGQRALDASDWAHAHSVGWRLTEDGERIPYETVFLSPGGADRGRRPVGAGGGGGAPGWLTARPSRSGGRAASSTTACPSACRTTRSAASCARRCSSSSATPRSRRGSGDRSSSPTSPAPTARPSGARVAFVRNGDDVTLEGVSES